VTHSSSGSECGAERIMSNESAVLSSTREKKNDEKKINVESFLSAERYGRQDEA
jgi:hypothetical protein